MDIFSALADPTRRQILERLQQNGALSIKQLSQDMPQSRQALTKHLNRLIKAKLISAEFVGKRKLHRLNAKPLQSLAKWVAPFAKQWDNRLENLVTFMENNDE